MARPISPSTRVRPRRGALKFDKAEISRRISLFYENDLRDRDVNRDQRLQRYAKYRQWVEGKDWPWEDASDVPVPDMMEKSLRLQDTLHNAVMSQRPVISATALAKVDKGKAETVDSLIDHQFFVEQPGEHIVGELAEAFCNDGVFTAYCPWVVDRQQSSRLTRFPAIPEDLLPFEYFRALIGQSYPNGVPQQRNSGWDWTITIEGPERSREIDVSFFTRPGDATVEMVAKEDMIVYDGPKIIVKDFDEVLHPSRAANLQPPGPSNPGGASHVILIDYPTIDEIRRLWKSGFYDQLTDDDFDHLANLTRSGREEDHEDQKDEFAGMSEHRKSEPHAKSHNTLTRLICFDRYDADNDGMDEDVVWWMILEGSVILKAKLLSELRPSSPLRRPLAEAAFVPVRGRRVGISVLEIAEGMHDAMKAIVDQTIDSGTLANVPFFFYRAHGGVKPETIRLWPGDGYPVPDPARDINFPRIDSSQSMAHGLNFTTLFQQWEDRVTTIGDFQLGRVPAGRASALRTIGGMSMLASQGEARPERILRRFFAGLSEIWAQIHELNEVFLPKGKQFLMSGVKTPNDDPYITVDDPNKIRGRFNFTFAANILNTSKQAMQENLGVLMGVYANPLTLQMGVIDPDGVYRLLRDFGKSRGQDPDRYLKPPTPTSHLPKILAEEAVLQIMKHGQMPDGAPMEPGGAEEHLQKLVNIMQAHMDPQQDTGTLTEKEGAMLRQWAGKVFEMVQQEKQQQQMLQAASQFAQTTNGGNQGGRPAEQLPPSQDNPSVGPNELLDESLPSAGGGGGGLS